jgi:excisionase family DNA binding protein
VVKPKGGRVSEQRFIGVRELADVLGLSASRCHALVRAGRIPALRDGRRVRVPRAWLEGRAREAWRAVREGREEA